MISRLYIYAFVAIGSLLAAFDGINFWAGIFFLFGILPIVQMRKKVFLIQLLLITLCIFIFYTYGLRTENKNVSQLSGEETILNGQILTEPAYSNTNQVNVQMQLMNGERVQIVGEDVLEAVFPSDHCILTGELNRPREPTNEFEFNYRHFLLKQRIHWIFHVSSDGDSVCERNTRKVSIEQLLQVRRNSLDDMSEKYAGEATGIIAALVFGDRSFLSDERLESYQKLGIIHLLAVSGLHVGLVTFAIFQLLIRVGITRDSASVMLCLFLPFYIILAGGAPSVVRASLMCIFVLLSSILKWKFKALDSISAVCILLLLYDPYYIYQLGFQLSFLTSFALIVSNRFFREYTGWQLMLRVTIVAQLISIPIILFHFYEVSLWTLPMNLLFIPFISMWILPLSFLFVLSLPLFNPLASFFYSLISLSLTVMHEIVDFVVSLNGSILVFGKPSNVIIIFMYAVIVLLFIQLESGRKRHLTLSLLAFVFVFAVQQFSPYFQKEAVITFLDVGQGDSIVIELPKRRGVYLIDTGGVVSWGESRSASSGPGSRIVEPFLKGKGIDKINKLIITHGHTDHMGEFCYLVDRFRVDEVLYPKSSTLPPNAVAQLICAQEKEIPLHWTEEGDRWEQADSFFYVLHPTGTEIDENERSIVLFASINEGTFLFTGDLEEKGERRIVNTYSPMQIDVLKVGHHGSNTSTIEPFLQHVSPKAGVIPVGRNSIYGHPHSDVVQRLYEHEVEVFRTDVNGAVEVVMLNGDIEIKPFIKHKKETVQ
ncbi:DNA internalization-related competence protein ComEC/Rec2 [Evansella halocellulosilytica]|uniref:DNA internalization-related competence protein ComEC/Rec2 n=1 Tax=Evansella halocellulosilytica TaxID=2011013 RepID=UPI000BB99F73|nr:DNA internalization-related competence protein ComEC/Rec2 [Evansella halocellulosilytica]